MNDVRYLEVSSDEAGQRLDNYLFRVLKGVPKSHVYRIVRGGEVRVNKKRAQVGLRLCDGDRLRIPPIRTSAEKQHSVGSSLAERLLASVLHEDAQFLVINKPAGLAVHGGSGLSLGVIEALRSLRSDLPYLELVHRLDRDTSGCLLLAKKRSALRAVQRLLAERCLQKTYWAVLSKPWQGKPTVTVDVALEKNTLKSGERMVVVNPAGKASQTQFRLLESFSQACWVEVQPKTGRTHQIRVHSAYLGQPIVGDDKYGQDWPLLALSGEKRRLHLHARSLSFALGDQSYSFVAELDQAFDQSLRLLRQADASC